MRKEEYADMERKLICADGELSIARNKTERYVQFLQKSIEEYSAILNEAADKGIEDVLVRRELQRLSSEVLSVRSELQGLYSAMADCVRREIQDVEDADRFTYPDISFGDIMSTLAGFF